MASQLDVYNRAIEVLGETRLASVTENRAIRRALDNVWKSSPTGEGGVKACLELGLWNFASRSVQASVDPDVTPTFGWSNAFSKPSDWVRTIAVSTDEFFKVPLLDYGDERGYWFTESYDTLYFRFVSNAADFGGDLTKWPESFLDVLAAYFALRVAPGHTKSREAVDELKEHLHDVLVQARSTDAINDPVQFPAPGSWVLARRGFRTGRDRGRRTSLTG